MIVPDINLLLYAHIAAFPQHQRAQEWWRQTLQGSEPVGLCSLAVFGFVRIATQAKVFSPPMHLHAALDTVADWLRAPTAHFVVPGPDHLERTSELLRQSSAGGRLTTDAQLAALALHLDAALHSNDSDFARFPGLRWVNPLQ